jgi:hypothetical protein
MELLLYLFDSAGGAGTRGFSGRRHCAKRHRRLSAWDRRRNRKMSVQLENSVLGGKELQHSSAEHTNDLYPVIG